jgi:hypothetical protein
VAVLAAIPSAEGVKVLMRIVRRAGDEGSYFVEEEAEGFVAEPDLLLNYLKDPNPQVRLLAGVLISHTGEQRFKARLLKLLRDPDPEVRDMFSQELKYITFTGSGHPH